MKNNFKFFSIVLALLLASSIVLTGCMYAIAADYGNAKAYDMGSQINANSGIIADNNTPISQTELQKKFSAMYDISEDGKTVTVISEEYLKDYWQSSYEKEVIHSLTTEEVYFIIQDSIRIYKQYNKVILVGFESNSSNKQVAERFPYLEGAELTSISERSFLDCEKIEGDIHKIILYRLGALSSPKAFFTGTEAISFVGGDPAVDNSMYPESVFYIPGYSANTDRDYILSVMGGSTNFTDLERFSDLFRASPAIIEFLSKTDGGSLKVFPTDDMYHAHVPDGSETSKGNKPDSGKNNAPMDEKNDLCYFKLDISNGTCSLMSSNGKVEAVGTYTSESNAHILTFDGDFQYVIYCNGYEYVYAKGESNPISGYEFEDEQSFILDGDVLVPIDR